ncbi:MAG: sortase, partial [Anaerolineae bacterium]|nr:sortase [Anaerolineae bacterium]
GICPTGSTCTNTLNTDPNLSPLADNGGYTETMALGAGSSAIDTGGAITTCTSTDQRSVTRPQGVGCDIGAYELDSTIPTVASNNLVASYTAGPASFMVTFSENVANPTGDTDTNDVTNPANYLLLEEGITADFQTTACNNTDMVYDTQITVDSVSYNAATFTATVNFNNGTPLPDGNYQLFVCGTTSITDIVGNHLNNGVDSSYNFTVQPATATSLPATGFRHGRISALPKQPTAKAYTETAMLLEIPKLGVSMLIVGVPQSDSGWDATWLGNSAGYLAGSAFPTWAGNTVITAHVWDAYNNPGIFSDLKTLGYGDQVQIQAWGLTYTYEVRESNLVTKKNVSTVLQSEEYDWVTLVTCEFYNPFTGDYLFRRAVRAVLVSVK